MSPLEQTVRMIAFVGAVSFFWCGLVPLTLGTIEQLLGLHKPRSPR